MDLRNILEQPVFSRTDLVRAGMSERTIKRRVADGTFVRVGPGLLCHRGRQEFADTRDYAAYLSSGAPLTGPSAARFFPKGPVSELVLDTKPWLVTSKRGRLPAVRLPHPSPEIVERKGLLVASPRQAALDCLRALPLASARDLAFRCRQQGLLTPEDIGREVDLLRNLRGTVQLRHLGRLTDSNAHAESERRFHRKLRAAGLLDWTANLWVLTSAGRVCIDIAFEAQRLAIEFDSPLTHSSPDRFRADRRKWNGLKRAGWSLLNYTWDDVTASWQRTLDEIRFFLRG